MKKKGQITLIIAIALLILIVAAFIIYAGNYFRKNSKEPLIFERASIENYINNCIKSTAENGLRQLGGQGFVADNLKITSIEEMQSQLSSYMNSNLGICLKDFEDFQREGWDVEKGIINAKSQINEQDVSFDVNYPIKVSSKGSVIGFDRLAARINIRLKHIYELASKIVEFKINYNKEVDLTTLSEYDLQVTIFPDKGYFVYVIDDPKSLMMNEPYRFILKIKA